MKPPAWTPRELELLRREFPVRETKDVAEMIGRSYQATAVMASKLGLEKEPGFLEKRRRDIQELAREGLRRTSRKSTRFKKGERANPAGEFKKGHRLTPEQEAKRIASLKYSWEVRRRKDELRKHGIKI